MCIYMYLHVRTTIDTTVQLFCSNNFHYRTLIKLTQLLCKDLLKIILHYHQEQNDADANIQQLCYQ